MDGYVTIGTELDTKSFDKQIDYVKSQLDDIEDKLKKADMGFEVGDTLKLEAQYEKLTDKLRNLIKKKEEFNKTDFSGIKNSIQGLGSGLENITKKVAKWGLALFGIRSAYNFIRNSVSTLSQYDEQMGTNIEYIRYLLASTLQPVIENLIQLAYKLLAYVNYIAKAWFGVNLFANASVEAFEKQNKSLSKSAKKAKELQKTLTGFDEMNVLQDNGDVKSGGGVSLPSFPSMEDVPIPSWLQWIADNGGLIQTILLGIGTAIASLKLAELLQALGLFGTLPIWKLAGGIGLIISGVALAIKGVIDFLKDPTWQNFLTILEGIALVVAGIAILMGGWIVALVALGVAIVAVVIQNWDKVKEILGKVGGWIYDHIIKPIGDFFKGLWEGIKTGVSNAVDFVKNVFSSIINFFKNIISTIVGLFKTIGTTVGNVISGAFKAVINGVLSAIENILNFPIRSINKLIGVINKVPGIDLGYLSTFSLPRLAKGGIINQPGRGVQLGSAIGGERGQEGVIPLTDSQQMEILGEAIGRYITINAEIINNMNGRTISRELKKIDNRDNFLYNR